MPRERKRKWTSACSGPASRSRGATVACASRDSSDGEQVARELDRSGERAAAFAVDVRSEESLRALRNAVIERFGGVDILVNNAGIAILEGAANGTADGWRDV